MLTTALKNRLLELIYYSKKLNQQDSYAAYWLFCCLWAHIEQHLPLEKHDSELLIEFAEHIVSWQPNTEITQQTALAFFERLKEAIKKQQQQYYLIKLDEALNQLTKRCVELQQSYPVQTIQKITIPTKHDQQLALVQDLLHAYQKADEAKDPLAFEKAIACLDEVEWQLMLQLLDFDDWSEAGYQRFIKQLMQDESSLDTRYEKWSLILSRLPAWSNYRQHMNSILNITRQIATHTLQQQPISQLLAQAYTTFITTLIQDNQLLLGHATFSWSILALGDISRGQLLPAAHLGLVVLLAEDNEENRHYIAKLLRMIELNLVMVAGTLGKHARSLQIGIKLIDLLNSLSCENHWLIDTPDGLEARLKREDHTFTGLLPYPTYVAGDKNLYHAYQLKAQSYLQHNLLSQSCARQVLTDSIKQIALIESSTVSLKTLMSLLEVGLLQPLSALGLMHGISSLHLPTLLERLATQKLLSPVFVQQLKLVLSALYHGVLSEQLGLSSCESSLVFKSLSLIHEVHSVLSQQLLDFNQSLHALWESPDDKKATLQLTRMSSALALSSEVSHLILTQRGIFKRNKINESQHDIHCLKIPRIHLKYCPDSLMDIAYQRLSGLITGYQVPMVLGRLKTDILDDPVLISQTVNGDDLGLVLHQAPERLKALDKRSTSLLILFSLLVNPGDDKPTNFIVEPFINWQGEKSVRLVNIDTQPFMPAVYQEGSFQVVIKPMVKSIVFLIDNMQEAINTQARDTFLALDANEVLQQWLAELIELDKQHEATFKTAIKTWLEREDSIKTTVPFTLRDDQITLEGLQIPGLISVLYQKIKRLQRYLTENPQATHLELLCFIEPVLGQLYKQAWADTTLKTPIERFKRLSAGQYSLVIKPSENGDQIIFPTTVSRRDVQQYLLGGIPQKTEILVLKTYSPENASKRLTEIVLHTGQLQTVLTAIQQEKLDVLKILGRWTADEKEALLQQLDFAKLSFRTQTRLWQEFKNESYRQLYLKNSQITDSELLLCLKNSPNLLVLDIRGCANLTALSLENAAIYCPRLQQIIVDDLKSLSFVSTTWVGNPLVFPDLVFFSAQRCLKLKTIQLDAPQLKKLLLNDSQNLTVLKTKSQALEHLELRNNKKLVLSSEKIIEIGALSHLHTLDISGCDIKALSLNVPNLQTLLITDCKQLEDAAYLSESLYLVLTPLPIRQLFFEKFNIKLRPQPLTTPLPAWIILEKKQRLSRYHKNFMLLNTPHVIQSLMMALQHENKEARIYAVKTLEYLGQADKAVETLLPKLRNQNSQRGYVAEALGRLQRPNKAVIVALLFLLQDKDNEVRGDAAIALGRLRRADKAVVEALWFLFQDKDTTVRECAAIALSYLGQANKAVIKELRVKLKREAPRYYYNIDSFVDDDVIRIVLSFLEPSNNGIVLEDFKNFETETDETVIDRLLTELQDKNSGVRFRAAEALGRLGRADKTVIEVLLQLLKDEYLWIGGQAAIALSNLISLEKIFDGLVYVIDDTKELTISPLSEQPIGLTNTEQVLLEDKPILLSSETNEQKQPLLNFSQSFKIPYDAIQWCTDGNYQPICLGQGAFAEVYKGVYQNRLVAIKQLNLTKINPTQQAKALNDFQEEYDLLSKLQHPNIIGFHGVCNENGVCRLIIEYAPKGLFTVIHNKKSFSWTQRYQIAINLAEVIDYCHQQKLLHRDLKSLNVLLDDDGNPKLCDFGCSKIKTEEQLKTINIHSNQEIGTLRWMAPELMDILGKYTFASDVFSYGMILWELASRKIPYENLNNAEVQVLVSQGEREDIPDRTPPTFAKLIKWCWSQTPKDRPTMAQVVKELKDNQHEAFTL